MSDYYRGRVYGKPPLQAVIYEFRVTNFLTAGDTVQSAVVNADDGITATLLGNNDDSVNVKISGGTAGTTYAVNMVATTTNGEAVDMLVYFEVNNP